MSNLSKSNPNHGTVKVPVDTTLLKDIAAGTYPWPANGKILYVRDTVNKHLGFSVTEKGVISFMYFAPNWPSAVKHQYGKVKRMVIQQGYYRNSNGKQTMTLRQAEVKINEYSKLIANGKHPVGKGVPAKAKHSLAEKADELTLEVVLKDHLKKNKTMTDESKDNYRRFIKRCFGDYMQQPLVELDMETISDIIREKRAKEDKSLVNGLLTLEILYNSAMGMYHHGNAPIFTFNPVKALKEKGEWSRYSKRESGVMPQDFPKLFAAINSMKSQEAEYIYMMLFTGCRSGELRSKLTWDKVDIKNNYYTLEDTKNKLTVDLPLPEYIATMLRRRYQDSGKTGEVFAEVTNHGSDLMDRLEKAFGERVRFHDLRRTFASFAVGVGIHDRTVKILMNHKEPQENVTDQYVIQRVSEIVSRRQGDHVKAAIEKVADEMLIWAGMTPPEGDKKHLRIVQK